MASAKAVANALVSSRFDYCNSLLYNIADKDLSRLQRVQNCLARVVFKAHRFCHVTPLRKSLHWLPVRERIQFKLCCTTYQVMSNQQPHYLFSMLSPADTSRGLRSSSHGNLKVPRVKTNFGSRAFSVSGPVTWNSLPTHVKLSKSFLLFHRSLKSHFFNQVFPT